MLGIQTSLRHISFGLVVVGAGLAPCAFAGSGGSTRLSVTGTEKLQRIIIQYKSEKSSSTSRNQPTVQSAQTDGTARIAALNRRNDLATAPTLSYIKSITPRTHVARTASALSRTDLQALVNQIAQDPSVEYAEIDEKAYPHFTPNDNDFALHQWSMQGTGVNLGASKFTAAWDRVTNVGAVPIRGTGVVVAVLDTGYRPHPDLVNNILTGYDFVSEDSPGIFITANDLDARDADATDPGDWNTNAAECDISDSSWHGTLVSGIVAAQGNNNNGMAGGAFGAKILPVRVLGICGGYVSDIADGIRWAAGLAVISAPANTTPAKVINLSLGGDGACSATYQNAINAARTQGSTVVVSTGNDGSVSTLSQPANCQGVIAVTAHDETGDNAGFANIGAGTALSAPGVRIYSTANSSQTRPNLGVDEFQTWSGTSFSAPHVSAVAALMLQANPSLTPDQVKSRMVNATRAFPSGTYCDGLYTCGTGMLDADAAVAAALADTAPYTSASADHSIAVSPGTAIIMTGTATAGTNGAAVTTMEWTQLAGPTVTLSQITTNPSTRIANLTIPGGTFSSLYVFRFRATSATSQTSDSVVSISTSAAPASGGGGGGGGAWEGLDAWIGLGLLLAHLSARGLGRRRQTRRSHC